MRNLYDMTLIISHSSAELTLQHVVHDAIRDAHLDLSTHCYFEFFSSGSIPVFPQHVHKACGFWVLTKLHRFNSIIMSHEQECFTFWSSNLLACNSFGQAKHCRGISMWGKRSLAGAPRMTAPCGSSSGASSHQPGSLSPAYALHRRCCSADLTRWWIDMITPCNQATTLMEQTLLCSLSYVHWMRLKLTGWSKTAADMIKLHATSDNSLYRETLFQLTPYFLVLWNKYLTTELNGIGVPWAPAQTPQDIFTVKCSELIQICCCER